MSSRWITILSYKVFPFHPAHVWTQSVAQHFHHFFYLNASCGSESSHFEWIMLPLHVSCYLWMSRAPLNTSRDLKHVTSECVMLPCFTLFNCESPISPQSLTCSLQRVNPYPTLEVIPSLLLLTCRLQWVPTPYTWSSTRASRGHALIIIPDVLTDRLQWVLTPYICSSTRVSCYPPLQNIPNVLTCRLQ